MSNAKFAEMVALLVKAPRTAGELAEMLEYRDAGIAEKSLNCLRDEGLVYIKEWRRVTVGRYLKLKAIYAWQPSICEFTDACVPASTKSSRHAIRHSNGLG